MHSKNAKQTSARRAPAKRAPRQSQAQNDSYTQFPHEATLEGLVNPFSNAANGAMLPDIGNGRVLTERITNEYPITTDATGAVCLMYQASPKFQQLQGTLAGTTWSGAATFDVTGTNYSKNERGVRAVTFGMRVYTTLSATAASGRLVLLKSNTMNNSAITLTPNNFTAWESYPLAHGEEFAVVSHSTGSEQLVWDNAEGANNTDFWNTGLQSIGLYIVGAPASTVIGYVETVLNEEALIDPGTPLSALARQQPVYNPAMFTAADEARSRHGGLFRGAKEAIGKELKAHVKQAAAKHLPKLGKALLKLAL